MRRAQRCPLNTIVATDTVSSIMVARKGPRLRFKHIPVDWGSLSGLMERLGESRAAEDGVHRRCINTSREGEGKARCAASGLVLFGPDL